MTNKINKRLSFVSAIADSKPIDLKQQENNDDSDDQNSNSDSNIEVVNVKQAKGDKNFLSKIINESTSFKDRQTVYVASPTAKRVKMLATITGYDMTRIIDGVINNYLDENAGEIKKLMKKYS